MSGVNEGLQAAMDRLRTEVEVHGAIGEDDLFAQDLSLVLDALAARAARPAENGKLEVSYSELRAIRDELLHLANVGAGAKSAEDAANTCIDGCTQLEWRVSKLLRAASSPSADR